MHILDDGVANLSAEVARVTPVSPAGARPDDVPLILVCLICGKTMDQRACKLVCSCGYFLSCSDFL